MKPNWFIGLPVPTDGWLGPLLGSAPRSVRRFHPADVHVTVAFLGPVTEQAARQGWATVAEPSNAPLEIELGPLEPMGNPRRPSALSALVMDGREALVTLLRVLRDPACRAAGARLDERAPLPHVTVARPPRNATGSERREAIDWARAQPPVGARVVLDRLVLFTWATDRRERQFREVCDRRLSP